MQVQKINSTPNFQGHGAKNFGEVMERLYKESYKSEFVPHELDILQFASKMRDGKEVIAVADFCNGKFLGISFPYQFAKYRTEFCNKLFKTYNKAVTKGKSTRRPH